MIDNAHQFATLLSRIELYCPGLNFIVWYSTLLSVDNYLGTLNGIRVYNAAALDKQAILCSSRLVESLTYGVVNSPDDLVDFSFIVDEDVERCLIEFHFAQRINWADHPFLEVQFEEAGEGVVATI